MEIDPDGEEGEEGDGEEGEEDGGVGVGFATGAGTYVTVAWRTGELPMALVARTL